MGQDRIYMPKENLKPCYEDPKKGMIVWKNTKKDSGFMSFVCAFKGFKLAEFGKNLTNKDSLHFAKSGVYNLVPYILEAEMIPLWSPFIYKVDETKMMSGTRFFITEQVDLPFPLSKRKGQFYF